MAGVGEKLQTSFLILQDALFALFAQEILILTVVFSYVTH
jgi:hypothetical protein